MNSEIPKLAKISAWIWIFTGMLTSILIIIQTMLTLKSANFNHHGIIQGSIFMIFFVLAFANVGRLVLRGKLKNITGNAIVSIVFSLIILYFTITSLLIDNSPKTNFTYLLILVPVFWVLAGIMALIEREKYNQWILGENSISYEVPSALLKTIGKKILFLFAFVTSFIIVKYAIYEFNEQNNFVDLETNMSQLQKEALENNPQLSPTLALQKESKKRIKNTLDGLNSTWQKENAAADSFWGFYFINTKSRHEYCKKLNVNISPFAKAFSEIHLKEYSKAKHIYEQSGISEETVWDKFKDVLYKDVVQDMNEISSYNQISTTEVCILLSENASDIVPEMHLSKKSPEIYKALMGAP